MGIARFRLQHVFNAFSTFRMYILNIHAYSLFIVMHQITTAFFLLIKKPDKQKDIIHTVLIIGQMTSSEIQGLYI